MQNGVHNIVIGALKVRLLQKLDITVRLYQFIGWIDEINPTQAPKASLPPISPGFVANRLSRITAFFIKYQSPNKR